MPDPSADHEPPDDDAGTDVDHTDADRRVGGSDAVADPGDAGGAALPVVADHEVTDSLPEDLDVSEYVGPYVFPNNNRRRVPGYLYLALAAFLAVLYFVTRSSSPVLVNAGMLWAALGLALVGGYHLLSGFDLDVDEQDALVAATRRVAFPVGHASAQLGWRGLRSRPTWRILLYSAENPPATRGLVLVDGVDGEIIDWFTEPNPEDWSDLDGTLESATHRPVG